MKKLGLFTLSLLALASVGCEKQPQNEPEEAKQLTIVASTDGTILPEWKAQDEITVVCKDEMYTFVADKAGKTANFTEAEGFLTADVIGNEPVAAYVNCTNMFGAFKIQAEQTWKDGANPALIPAYAYTMNAPVDNKLALAFKPLASVLNLTVAPYEMTVEKIVVAPAEGATVSEGALAGTFTADASQGSVKVGNGLNEVVLTLAAPMDLKQGATFNIPLGWFTVEGGLAITMVYDNGKEYPFTVWTEGAVKSYNDEGGLKSSKVIAETLEFDANSFPRAWYVKSNAAADAKGLSWDAAATLDYALANARPGSVLHVAAGNYVPTTAVKYYTSAGDGGDAVEATAEDGFKSFLIDKNITVIGGYPANATAGAVADPAANATILDGNAKSYHVLVVAAEKVAGEKVVIEGITVKGGANANANNAVFFIYNGIKVTGNYAAGVAVLGTAVDMSKVTVTANSGDCAAGMYCMGSDINMVDCAVSGNTSTSNGSGAWFGEKTKLVMDRCDVSGNTSGGLAGGLYLHVAAGEGVTGLEAEVKNSNFNNNVSTGNAGGAYVREDTDQMLMKSSFTNCHFDGNTGGMGVAAVVLNAKTSFTDCTFNNNRNTANGTVYVYTSGTCGADVTFNRCQMTGNALREDVTSSIIGGLYAYHPASGQYRLTVLNSEFSNNSAKGRNGGVYLRSASASGAYGYVANCTFSGNNVGGYGSGVDVYAAAGKPATLDLVSCTVAGNAGTAAVACETADAVANVYNCIISGNTNVAGTAAADLYVKAGAANCAINCKYTIVGADYYGADGVVATVTPKFDYATMLAALNDGVVKLVGNASSNPAFGNGMTATDLKKLANGNMTADVLAKDQKGNARTDSDKVIGACVK